MLPESEDDKKAFDYVSGRERLQRVKELCSNLPKPEQFYFVSDAAPKMDDTSALVASTYHSDRALEEIAPSFLVWFNSNGWRQLREHHNEPVLHYHDDYKPVPEHELTFSKNNQTISIFYYNVPKNNDYLPNMPNYAIRCQEISAVND